MPKAAVGGVYMKMVAQFPHNVVLDTRKTHCEISDLIDKGKDIMEKAAHGEDNIEMDDREEGVEIEDVSVEV